MHAAARILPSTTAQLVPIQTARLAHAGQMADHVAARDLFFNYRMRKAQRTRDAHDADLARFTHYLADAGVTVGDLATDPAAWPGVSWGIAEGFVRWQLSGGYAIGSINRALSTIKTYARLALKAGAIDATTYALINVVEGYGHTEGTRIDEQRERTRVGAKKADAIAISHAQAKQLKQQPATPQGRRDALLMCILLDHGFRCGEIAILKRSAIDLATGLMIFYRPKVDLVQTHRLTHDTLAAARAYLAELPPGDALLRGSCKTGQLVGTMGTRAINARVRTLGAAIGLDHLSPHDCRHAWATFATEAGTPIKALQVAGGWNSPAMPLRYTRAAEIANEGVRLS